MNFLPDDIIYNIIFMLDFDSIIKFAEINKEINTLLDNIFFNNLAVKYYSDEFWMKATLRPKHISKPLKSMKLELMRIEKFQDFLEKLENKRWTNEKFYNLWDNENCINNNNCNNRRLYYSQ